MVAEELDSRRSLVPPGHAERREAASSVAYMCSHMRAPCVLSSRRPARPGDEASFRVEFQTRRRITTLALDQASSLLCERVRRPASPSPPSRHFPINHLEELEEGVQQKRQDDRDE